ncbi:hypothetical protein DYB37_005235 [Aphanomyces astaci]|uniref:Uncharacterized protein n=1 Tax=Aphanomyces astaci TaxID=112090 RepID=A0A3R6XBJ7_APHAT|nr:hypothetical protein DYB37_005235 [Aphanomyces astaci]
MAVADASVPTASSSCFPTHAPLVPPVVLDGSSSHYASPPSSPSSNRILDLPPSSQPAPQAVADALKVVHDLEVDEAIDVQHELQTMQSVMHHIDLALRGETPHQIAQRETREAARQERERQRLERQLAQHEQHVQRLASRLAKQPSNVVP